MLRGKVMVERPVVRIFLSSPGDVGTERELALRLIKQILPGEAFIRDRVTLEVVAWDDPNAPVAMPASLTPQEAINQGRPRPSECDIVVVMLWSRMGTPLPAEVRKPCGDSYLSGTEWEYEDAMSAARNGSRPVVLLYRRTEAPQTSLLDPEIEAKRRQYLSVEQFFARLRNADGSLNGSFHTYSTPKSFAALLHQHLRDTLEKCLRPNTSLTRGLSVSGFQTRIDAFISEYLQSETGPVPFGGREPELLRLAGWLRGNSAPSRCLITAPAGRGKSALLVRWMDRLQREGQLAGPDNPDSQVWNLVFVPISMRFGTNAPHVFYQALAERLAAIENVVLSAPSADAAGHYADSVRDILTTLAKSGRRVLVVLDGLDEALRGEFDASLFPRILPATLRIVVSARWVSGDHDSSGWRQRLGWDSGTRCMSIDLAVLDAGAISQVLISMGAPLDVAGSDPEVVTRLAQLTQGEPLLLYYYALDLWQKGSTVTRITRQDLDRLAPGFGPYFDRWLENQRRAWREAGEQVDQHDVDAVLMILAYACGPLEGSDLIALVAQLRQDDSNLVPAQLLDPLRRFVIGDGSAERGYVLSHPKIGEHFQNSRFRDARVRVEHAFVAWGKQALLAVNRAPNRAASVPRYLLQFHRRHLQAVHAPYEDFLVAVEDGWRRAWEYFEGSQQGFAADVRAAWEAMRHVEPLHDPSGQIRCVLTLTSIRSLGHEVPGELVAAAARHNVLSVRQALHLASFMRDRIEYTVTLASVAADSERDPVLQREMLTEALAQARTLDQRRVEALVRLAPYILPEQRMTLLQALSEVPLKPQESLNYAEALAGLANHWQGRDLEQVCAAALQVGMEVLAGGLVGAIRNPRLTNSSPRGVLTLTRVSIQDETLRAATLVRIAAHLPRDLQSQVLSAAEEIRDPSARAFALLGLSRYLKGPVLLGVSESLRRVLLSYFDSPHFPEFAARAHCAAQLAVSEELQRQNGNGSFLAVSLAAVRKELAPLFKKFGTQQLQDQNQMTDSITTRVEFLRLASLLDDISLEGVEEDNTEPAQPEETVQQALAAAKTIPNRRRRAQALRSIADRLSPEQLAEALGAAKSVGDGDIRVGVLIEIAGCLKDSQREGALRSAAAAAQSISDPEVRSVQLRKVALQMQSPQREETLHKARLSAEQIGTASHRARGLSELAAQLAGAERAAVLAASLSAARGIRATADRARVLCEIAGSFPDTRRFKLVAKTMALVRKTPDEDLRSWVITELARHGSSEQRQELYELGCLITNDNARARCLAGLIPYLPATLTDSALDASLAAARAVGNPGARAAALTVVVAHLPAKHRADVMDKALADVRKLPGGHPQVAILLGMVKYLSGGQRTAALEIARTAAAQIGADDARANVLGRLLGALEGQQSQLLQDDVLEAAERVSDETMRVAALSRIAKLCKDTQGARALEAALATATHGSDAYVRATSLGEIAGLLTGEQWDAAFIALIQTGEDLPRPELLGALQAFIPMLHTRGGTGALMELQRAIVDTGAWYP